ncbi:hypothetical protein ACWC09_33030 [Streptomyces sp. NPDC001617]
MAEDVGESFAGAGQQRVPCTAQLAGGRRRVGRDTPEHPVRRCAGDGRDPEHIRARVGELGRAVRTDRPVHTDRLSTLLG